MFVLLLKVLRKQNSRDDKWFFVLGTVRVCQDAGQNTMNTNSNNTIKDL